MGDVIIQHRFGRLPRIFNPAVPHLSAQRMRLSTLPPPPVSVNWMDGVDPNFGAMLNDQLGCCEPAHEYHGMQIWSAKAGGKEITEPDACVLQTYEEVAGYNPSDPSTDRGTVMQVALTDWLNTGVPIVGNAGAQTTRSKLLAFIEVDPHNHDDVKRVINECGGISIGTNVPSYLVDGPIPMVWDVNPSGDQSSAGGHAIFGPGYDANGVKFISWGSGAYSMTWAFWDAQVDECYALLHPWWLEATGTTPLGMMADTWEAQMSALRMAA